MGTLDDLVPGLEGFEWDAGNADKNWLRHAVRQAQAEQALLDTPLVVAADVGHSEAEARLLALGHTDAGRLLTIVFTVRGRRIRVISARAMSKTERTTYGQAQAEPEAHS
jgi:hypothetical protein